MGSEEPTWFFSRFFDGVRILQDKYASIMDYFRSRNRGLHVKAEKKKNEKKNTFISRGVLDLDGNKA